MTRAVVFIDTSVLVEVLGVPGKSQRSAQIRQELSDRHAAGEQLVLPAAAIVETGNHIAQLPNGDDRRRYASSLARILEQAVAKEAPWVLHGASWDEPLVRAICDGPGGCPALGDMASQRIGAGDVSILAEADAYRSRVTHVRVTVWTLEAALASYA